MGGRGSLLLCASMKIFQLTLSMPSSFTLLRHSCRYLTWSSGRWYIKPVIRLCKQQESNVCVRAWFSAVKNCHRPNSYTEMPEKQRSLCGAGPFLHWEKTSVLVFHWPTVFFIAKQNCCSLFKAFASLPHFAQVDWCAHPKPISGWCNFGSADSVASRTCPKSEQVQPPRTDPGRTGHQHLPPLEVKPPAIASAQHNTGWLRRTHLQNEQIFEASLPDGCTRQSVCGRCSKSNVEDPHGDPPSN